MDQGYNDLGNGMHAFFEPETESTMIINTYINRGFYEKSGATLEDGALNETEALNLVEAMKVPGTGLGMLLIKLGRAFSRAVGGGSSAK